MNRLTRRHALAFMVLCLLVAAALRLPDLPDAPPGLHYDEAANALLAGDIGLRGERPIFISSYTGKEVFFFYAAGIMMRLVGESVFALRLTAAFLGLLSVAATYWLGREMLADRRVALLAASLLAVSFWHVLFSRLGFRAITEPLLQALTIAALFRGLRREDNRWLLAGGLLLGLTAYTYLAARLFPVLLLIGLLPILLNKSGFPRRWRQLGIYLGAALAALLPLLFYFMGHQDAFWVRITQVSPASGASGLALGESLLRSWGMFFLQGDPFWRFNIPGRPLFNWILGGLLIVGWIAIILRWRRFPYDWQRAALTLLIFAPLVMILPTALATNEIVPSNLRALGLIPFIYFLPAVAVVILLHDLERRFGRPPVTFAVLFVVLLVLLSGGLATSQAYFGQWAGEKTLFYESDGDLAAVARYLAETDLTGKTVYVAAPHYRHPTLAFLSDAYEQVKWLPDARALVFPAQGPALVIYPFNSPAPDWAMPYLDEGRRVDVEFADIPADAYSAYELPSTAAPVIDQPLDIDFGGSISLLGYEVGSAAGGADLPVTLIWRVDNRPEDNYMPFVQLEDSWGHRWSQEESFAYPAEQWEPGDTILQRVQLPVHPGTPPGSYRLRIGLFEPTSEERLPRLDQEGRYAGDSYFIEDVAIEAGEGEGDIPEPPFVRDGLVLPGLRLLGYERGGSLTKTGAPWGFSLWWQATETLPPLTTAIDLVAGDGTARTILETQPVHDTYPFAEWQTPQFIIDRQTLSIPLDVTAGDYRLRLHLKDAQDREVFAADLGPLSVEKSERLFVPPSFENKLDARFGSEIALLGYDLTQENERVFSLDLVWQAVEEPAADYTVFIHVLDQDGTCCVWQQDAMPRQNQHPTSGWLPGEVVADSYTITLPDDLPPGAYPLEVGLYVAETGRRLSAGTPGTPEGDMVMLRPLQVP